MAGLPSLGGAVQETVQARGAAGDARDGGRGGGRGRLVHVGDADRDGRVGGVRAVGGGDRDRVGGLGLVVVGHAGLGLDLSRGRDDVEGRRVGAAEGVGEGVAGVGVGGRHGGADVLARGGVLGDRAADRGRVEHGRRCWSASWCSRCPRRTSRRRPRRCGRAPAPGRRCRRSGSRCWR